VSHRPGVVALLRGINVGGRNRMPMAELRALCADLGWTAVRSYIQSGNLVMGAREPAQEVEARLEEAIRARFGIAVPVIVRSTDAWHGYTKANPFPRASAAAPNLVMLALSKGPPADDAVAGLRARSDAGERIERVGDAIWIDYGEGAARSRVAPAQLDRWVGSPVTTRNWRTVLAVREMLERAGADRPDAR
jgi:uncharacterized protein (DUF1697 family)